MKPGWAEAGVRFFCGLVPFAGKRTGHIDRNNHIQGKVPLSAQTGAIKVVVKKKSDGRRLNPKVPAVIVNPRIRYYIK